MAYGIDTVFHDFDERVVSESLDPLDGELAHHASEFDWPVVERALGEAAAGLDDENRHRLAEALWRLVGFALGDSVTHGLHRVPHATSFSSIGRRVIALGFVTGHPALEDASLRQIARASGGTAAARAPTFRRRPASSAASGIVPSVPTATGKPRATVSPHLIRMPPDPGARLRDRVHRPANAVAALRVVRWCAEWPPTHRDAQPRPDFLLTFERRHGPGPASADRALVATSPVPY